MSSGSDYAAVEFARVDPDLSVDEAVFGEDVDAFLPGEWIDEAKMLSRSGHLPHRYCQVQAVSGKLGR